MEIHEHMVALLTAIQMCTGAKRETASIHEIETNLSLTRVELQKRLDEAVAGGLIRDISMPSVASRYKLTVEGKLALAKGFPSPRGGVANTFHVRGNMINSPVQQGGHGAVQTATIAPDTKQRLAPLLEQLVAALADSKLPADDKRDIEGNLDGMLGQLKVREPDKPFLQRAWGTIQRILENAAGGLVSAGALALIPQIDALLRSQATS